MSEVTVHAPDGGWGWLVTFSSFMSHFLIDGVCYTFGVFFPEFLRYFGESKAKTQLLSSIMLGNYFVFGIGFSMMFLPSIVMIGIYFERRRAMAMGLAVCGAGVGNFVFAPLGKFLLEEYGWRGTMWVISAIMLNGLYIPFNFLPALAGDLNMSANQRAFLISLVGISNTVTRVLVGYVTDKPWANTLIIINSALLIGGVFTCFVPFYTTFVALAIYAVLFGAVIGKREVCPNRGSNQNPRLTSQPFYRLN
ncbi:monocarboxylate transporter 9-like [Pecten maximus]|uniref:monocarboxylate transporter 9-like n=1 Tax=Pecten maximus TaxID=6579 RepID=UPI0014584112|nr:monocarboxylate transporter 9-like [Pecten maximus]